MTVYVYLPVRRRRDVVAAQTRNKLYCFCHIGMSKIVNLAWITNEISTSTQSEWYFFLLAVFAYETTRGSRESCYNGISTSKTHQKILISSTPDFGEKPCESHTQHIAQHIILMFLTFGIFFLDFFCLYFFDSDILRFAPSVRSFDAGTIRSGTSYSWMWTWCGSRRYAREKHSNPQHFRVAYRMPRARFSLARSVACPFLCRSGSRTRI